MTLLLDASGIENTLADCGADGSNSGLPSFTVFVPKEAVWAPLLEQAGLTLGEILAQPALVKAILLYHVVRADLAPSQLTALPSMNLVSLGGLTLAITYVSDPLAVKVNNKPIVLRDTGTTPAERLENLEACNGWTYQLDGVLAPINGGPGGPGYPALILTMTSATSTTQSPYVPYTLQFSAEVKGIEPADFSNGGTAPGCSFTVAPRPSEWNSEFSVLTSCSGPGTVIPVFAAGGAIQKTAPAGPTQATNGSTATIVSGPTLTIEIQPQGGGTVTSDIGAMNCGTTCSTEFPLNSTVTLTAVPAAGHVFVGWSGACTGSQTCSVKVSSPTQVVAEFARAGQLTVIKAGGGQGSLSSKPAGINCGSNCTFIYKAGSQVTLTATAARGSRFVGWFGACTGSRTCVVTISGGAYQNFAMVDVFAVFEVI